YNTLWDIPTTATDYTPVWDANLYEWTDDAIRKGYRGLLTEEFRILKLARDGYITGPNGAPFGSAGPVIVCGVAARLNWTKLTERHFHSSGAADSIRSLRFLNS